MSNMVLSFNATSHEYSYPQGVEMRTAIDWGGVDGVSWLYGAFPSHSDFL